MGNLVLGIDDAGRGPVLGSMFLCGVLMAKDKEDSFRRLGVKDSKLLSQEQRVELEKEIKSRIDDFCIIRVSPDEIDSAVNTINLNTLEAKHMAEIINKINIQKRHKEKIKVIVDCPSTNITAWQNKLISFIDYTDNLDISCEHKADFNHPVVSAASILAKCEREEEVEKIKKKYKEYGNTGSGYPSDPATKEFLQKHGKKLKDSGIFRKTWATWKTMFPEETEKQQATLGDFK